MFGKLKNRNKIPGTNFLKRGFITSERCCCFSDDDVAECRKTFLFFEN